MKSGMLAAIGAYILWGLLPLYMHLVFYMPVFEVLAHRIIWALPTVLLMLAAVGVLKDLAVFLRKPKLVARCGLTAALITCNWGTYIWAIVNNHALDAALGYYITPLINILLGTFVFKEHLSRAQWAAFGLAVVAVLILGFDAGTFPWVAITIALTFSLYGFFKKGLPIGSAHGFAIEASLLFLPALCVALIYVYKGQNHFGSGSLYNDLLLIGMGPLTAVPLILYAKAAQNLSLSTLGIMQYIAPTLVFLVAIFILKESFSWLQFWSFVIIWTSIVIYTISDLRKQRQSRLFRANS